MLKTGQGWCLTLGVVFALSFNQFGAELRGQENSQSGSVQSAKPKTKKAVVPNRATNKNLAGGQQKLPSKYSMLKSANGVMVSIDQQPFAEYNFADFQKPILYPVYGPGQKMMTRHFPMKQVAGEANDHPHHRSLWIGHEVNGLDFWAGKTGRIKFVELEQFDPVSLSFVAHNQWLNLKTSAVILDERTRYQFGGDRKSRWIDATITFTAPRVDATFDDTKEGLFAIRTRPELRLQADPKRGVARVSGKAVNDSGVTGKAIWGKPAKWVSYWGAVEGRPRGIAIFDHPDNLRHPTTWHAREYGLVAANPFGLHHFTGAKKGSGAYTVLKGKSLALRYRVVFYDGAHDSDWLESSYRAFVGDGK